MQPTSIAMAFATCGATMPARTLARFVMPMITPANLGAMSR